MSFLLLGPPEKEMISKALEKARKNVVPWEELQKIVDVENDESNFLDLKDRKPGIEAVRRKYPSQEIILGTYRVTLSFAMQPAGMFKHVSISSHNRKFIPGMEAVQAIVLAFGFSGIPLQRPGRVWMEEFEPGWRAVNIVEQEAS